MQVQVCWHCGSMLPQGAPVCPVCGAQAAATQISYDYSAAAAPVMGAPLTSSLVSNLTSEQRAYLEEWGIAADLSDEQIAFIRQYGIDAYSAQYGEQIFIDEYGSAFVLPPEAYQQPVTVSPEQSYWQQQFAASATNSAPAAVAASPIVAAAPPGGGAGGQASSILASRYALGDAFVGHPAGVGSRVLALAVDLLAVAAVAAGVWWLTESIVLTIVTGAEAAVVMTIAQARTGASLGKLITRTRVAQADKPQSPGLWRASLRSLVTGAGALVAVVGAFAIELTALGDRTGKKRTIADRAAGTVVVAVPTDHERRAADEDYAESAADGYVVALDAHADTAGGTAEPVLAPSGVALPTVSAAASPGADQPVAWPGVQPVHELLSPPPSVLSHPAMEAPQPPFVEVPSPPATVVPQPLATAVPQPPSVEVVQPPFVEVPSPPAAEVAQSPALTTPAMPTALPTTPPPAATPDVLTQAPSETSRPSETHTGKSSTTHTVQGSGVQRRSAPAPEPRVAEQPLRRRSSYRAENQGTTLTFDTGQVEQLAPLATAILGRAPGAGYGDAQRIAVTDPSTTISKNHVRWEHDTDGRWITDLGSTNGTELQFADGRTVVLAAGERVSLEGVSVVQIGDRTFTMSVRVGGTTQ